MTHHELNTLFQTTQTTPTNFINFCLSHGVTISKSTVSRQRSGKIGIGLFAEVAYGAFFSKYQKQDRIQPPKTFSLADLDIISYSIGVPSLTESIVNESFAETLSIKIEKQGVSVDYVSLDDLGYISIAFRQMEIKDLQINAVLNALNSK